MLEADTCYVAKGSAVRNANVMRAMVLLSHGDIDQLQIRDIPRPGRKEVLIRVGASAVNNTDINTRVGWYWSGGIDRVVAKLMRRGPGTP